METLDSIDVHHHLIPLVFVTAMERRGISEVAGAPLPKRDPDRSLTVMDDNDIRSAVLSLSAPEGYFGHIGEACDLARACNEYAPSLRDRRPERFGMFAVLPMPLTEMIATASKGRLTTRS
ncbi:hypothetical protein [Rhizobium rhizogenes]|uniref:hypothetical protein n=1 Tax=Rhizobium rhizogenes TaxID=359 RepID=UPI001297E2FC|nr:hypothetical protein [Rhizobium rhizogenes]MQB34276.1 hypothetical protein [Rhizobium rhizogenes]